MSTIPPPRRAFEARLKIAGDTFDDFLKALRQAYLDLDDERHKVSGKIELCFADKAHSYVAYGDHKPEITAEKYNTELDRYVRHRVDKVNRDG